MMIQQKQLIYPDHRDEIAWLNSQLSALRGRSDPNDKPFIDSLLARIDYLMTSPFLLKDYP